jgi:hypothetical protein
MPATTIDVHDAQTQLMQLMTLALKGGDDAFFARAFCEATAWA